MAAAAAHTAPEVRLGRTGEDSIAASVVALVELGALKRPDLARELEGSVLLDFSEGHPPVRIELGGEPIVVCDGDRGDECDLRIAGRLADVVALLCAPLAGGLPKPTTSQGRTALARLADGRVEIDGSLGLGRKVLALLSVAS